MTSTRVAQAVMASTVSRRRRALPLSTRRSSSGELAGGQVGALERAGQHGLERRPTARGVIRSTRSRARPTRRRRERDAEAGVEAVEVGVAARVDPDALGDERRRRGAGLLERVDRGGDLAGDPDRRRGAERAVGEQLVEPPAGRRLRRPRRARPSSVRAS